MTTPETVIPVGEATLIDPLVVAQAHLTQAHAELQCVSLPRNEEQLLFCLIEDLSIIMQRLCSLSERINHG